ncbi:MAG TPA: hypothetical protein VMU33_10770 [Burkholderiaceae bacterium]|nr:hypothetical protein [Burkholderiaceae bacterium]
MNAGSSSRYRHLAAALAATAVLLAACGGGGASDSAAAPSSSGTVSQSTAQEVSADSATVPTSTTDALSTAVTMAQTVVAGAQQSQAYACPGGGSAVYTVSGATPAQLQNGKFDAGEIYSLTFTSCKGALGAGALDGSLQLTVISASDTAVSVATSTSDLVVSVPLGTVSINGSSTISVSTVTAGATTTETINWQTPSYEVTTVFGARTSTWTFTNVDRTRTITTTNGVLASTTYSGTATLAVSHPNGSWSVTVSSTGGVQYDANGVPQSGSWTIVYPHNTLEITVAHGTVTVAVDFGNDGTIDETFTFTNTGLVSSAG